MAVGARLYAACLILALVAAGASGGADYIGLRQSVVAGLFYLAFAGGAISGMLAIWVSTPRRMRADLEFMHWAVGLRLLSAVVALAAVLFSLLTIDRALWGFGRPTDWWQSISGGVAAWGMLLTDALYWAYLARAVRHQATGLARWGEATSARLGAVLLVLGAFPPPSQSQRLVTVGIVGLLVVVAFVWPAIYGWIWSRRVGMYATNG
jgi:hypothetical protein